MTLLQKLSKKNRLPLIGISLDNQDPGGYSTYAWSSMRDHYFQAVCDCGGLPVGLHSSIADFAGHWDGIILSGGDFDVPPEFYGQKQHKKTVVCRRKAKATFEKQLCLEAIASNIPLLGICGGIQILNVSLGGTLIQHISGTHHISPPPCTQVSHKIKIPSQTPLWALNHQKEEAWVNSSHHQAVDQLSQHLAPMAWSDDGLLEACYHPHQKCCWGIQWHPEFLVTDLDRRIHLAFIKACCQNKTV